MRPLVPFACQLPSRRILRVRGTDAHAFLQGIFTNDLRELHPRGSMYGCFLYFTGRVMCDAHLYQCARVHDGQASILIDVHESSVEELLDHLTEMKMRKKVVIDSAGDDLAVVAALVHSGDADPDTGDQTSSSSSSCGCGDEAVVGRSKPTTSPSPQTLEERHTECFADARNDVLFPALATPRTLREERAASAANEVPHDTTAPSTMSQPPSSSSSQSWQLKRCVAPLAWAPPLSVTDPYFELLYSRGVGEGPSVFKNGKTLPFEGNLDFLKGVSFNKGCYVGQELTHRTHVMLVTRKRTVPLLFGAADQPAPRLVEVGEPLYSAQRERIGEVSGVCGGVGVGLLRLRYVEKESRTVPGLQLSDGMSVQTRLPDWWPQKEVKKLLKNNG